MAAGYALVTGRGQGVLVHVDVGTANTANGMHNLFRSRLPVLLMAGKAPYTVNDELVGSRDTYVHFVQEPFDQASLVRPYLKWEWTLPSGVVVKEALRRAVSIMQSEPCGPVYLMMQRETLSANTGGPTKFAATPASNLPPRRLAAPIRNWSPRSPIEFSKRRTQFSSPVMRAGTNAARARSTHWRNSPALPSTKPI